MGSFSSKSNFFFPFRYLLILFRDAPVEVWAMTKTPIMVNWPVPFPCGCLSFLSNSFTTLLLCWLMS